MIPLAPEILLVSSRFDYTTDHIVCELERRGASFLRLNRDEFAEMSLSLTLAPVVLEVVIEGKAYLVTDDTLKGIYFRAPVFLRECTGEPLTADEQLSKQQWAAFVRALSVFNKARWINPIGTTFAAEIKPFQLVTASQVGFLIPRTVITNAPSKAILSGSNGTVAVKSLDSAVLNFGNATEGFVYTSLISCADLEQSTIATSPIIAQQPIVPKLDIRVTVVGQSVFPVAIADESGEGFTGDWRLEKDQIKYTKFQLPKEICQLCTTLVSRLGLTFGGIDLAVSGGDFYFIEVNPTGEWAWLAALLDLPIASVICDHLLNDV